MKDIPLVYFGHSRQLDALIKHRETMKKLDRLRKAFDEGVKTCVVRTVSKS